MTTPRKNKKATKRVATTRHNEDREGKRPTPRLYGIPDPEMAKNTPHEDDLKIMYGTKSGISALGIYISALQGLGVEGASYRSLVVSMGAEMEPRDAVEAMLLTQMATTHAALTRALGLATDAKFLSSVETYDRIANRLARTFTTQIETLRKYRSGGNQTVRVEHVTVNEGGQAIVGNVTTKGGGVET